MSDIPREKMQYIVQQFGLSVLDDPRRCEALLRDLCPENRREINILVGALREGVASDLMSLSNTLPIEIRFDRLTNRLYENVGMADEFAHWAVETLAFVTGRITGNIEPPAGRVKRMESVSKPAGKTHRQTLKFRKPDLE